MPGLTHVDPAASLRHRVVKNSGVQVSHTDKPSAKAQRPALFEELATYLDFGLSPSMRDQAPAVSKAATDIFREVFRGCQLLIPVGYRLPLNALKQPIGEVDTQAVPERGTKRITARERERVIALSAFVAKCRENLGQKLGFTPSDAERTSIALADLVCEFFGGQKLHVPNGLSIQEISARDQDIADRMGRGMADQLAREHHLTSVRIYQIARQVAKKKRLLAQQSLTATPSVQLAAATRQIANFFGPFP